MYVYIHLYNAYTMCINIITKQRILILHIPYGEGSTAPNRPHEESITAVQRFGGLAPCELVGTGC